MYSQCVDLVSKLLFFICYRGDKILQEGIAVSLEKLSREHEYSRQIVKGLIGQYGEREHKISKTSISNEVTHYKALNELLSKE